MTIGTLPDGARGFDCNAIVSPAVAERFRAHGYAFCVRYVRRAPQNSHDITRREVEAITGAGLALMLVQHVAPPGWTPSAALGAEYGRTAATEAAAAGYPQGATLWCDLEGVAPSVPTRETLDYCNAWYDAVRSRGFRPGLYVGDACGLTGGLLYYRLRFQAYWSAYNLNADCVPVVRGVMMRQRVAQPRDLVPGCPFEIDVNVIRADAKGGTPTLLLPPVPHAVGATDG